jgi:alpha-glucosidase
MYARRPANSFYIYAPIKPIMPVFRLTILLLLISVSGAFAKQDISITSPDKKIKFNLTKDASGLIYNVSYKGQLLVDNSRLSISFKEGGTFGQNISIGKPEFKKMEETYDLIVGKSNRVHSVSNEVMIPVTETGGLKRQLNIEVRIFNDGAAFRYVIPGKTGWQNLEITDESDSFNLTQDPMALTLFRENYTTSHEGLYDRLPVSKIKQDTLMDLPALFEYSKGIYMAITEANLLDYAGMYLIKNNGVLQSSLSPLPHQKEIKVIAKLPHNSPWRVMMISDRVGDLIESNISLT